MKNDILFDIDSTLFNISFFALIRDQLLSKLYKIKLTKVERYRFEYKRLLSNKREFNPKDLCEYICKFENHDATEMYNRVFEDKSIYVKSLFDDTLPTLKQLKAKDYNLGIFTQGVDYFQLNKVRLSNILKYFNKSLIFNFKNKENSDALKILPKGCVIVDDRDDILELIRNQRPDIRCILLKRDSSEHQKDIISDLTQLSFLLTD